LLKKWFFFYKAKIWKFRKNLCMFFYTHNPMCVYRFVQGPKPNKIQWTKFLTHLDVCHFFKPRTFKRDCDLLKINHPSILLPNLWKGGTKQGIFNVVVIRYHDKYTLFKGESMVQYANEKYLFFGWKICIN